MDHFKIMSIVNRTESQLITTRDLKALADILESVDNIATRDTRTTYDLVDIIEQVYDRKSDSSEFDHSFDFRVYRIDAELRVDVIIRDK